MLDPKLLRRSLNDVADKLSVRGFTIDINKISELESLRKDLQIKVENLQSARNVKSKEIGRAKAQGLDIAPILSEVETIKQDLQKADAELDELKEKLNRELALIPNMPHESVPYGAAEEDNLEIRKVGKLPEFDFNIKDHIEIGEALSGLDFAAASKITGSRFVVMQGAIARLHRALTQFMLDTHINEHSYQETYVPYMVNGESLFGTGQLPKFKEDLYELEAEDTLAEEESRREYYLVPTAEVPVTNLYRNTIVEAKDLPRKHVCHTPCFRSEAGSYGRDTKGLIRQHQFEKVELVQLVRPQESYEVLEQLTQDAEAVLQKLELPYRVVSLCGGDLGFSAAKTYDIEVWVPSQNTYREISSCSNFEDFQARRMQARWRNPETAKPELLHTLNGSGLAVGRTLVAVLENFQNADGSVTIPAVLRSYMNNQQIIKPLQD